jgi:four helix bundle protein
VVLAEGVHVDLRDVRHLRGYPHGRLREGANMRDYHQLDLWQRAMTYTVQIYEFTAQLPEAERYNLTAQLRRAATSVPLNIAEGSGCSTDAEFARFVGYAYRSLKEVVTGLELCQRLYPALPVPPGTVLIDEGNQISRMAHSLIQRLTTSTEPRAW